MSCRDGKTWPLWRRGRCGEGFNKRIEVKGSGVGTGKHGRCREEVAMVCNKKI